MLFHVIFSHSSADIILISAKIIYKYSTNNRKNDKCCKYYHMVSLLKHVSKLRVSQHQHMLHN